MESISIPRHRRTRPADPHKHHDPEHLSALTPARAARFRHRQALCLFGDESNESFTYGELKASALRVSSYLLEQGIRPGDRIAILSESRPRWGLAFFAILAARAVAMPLDPSQSADELRAILANGKPRMLLTSTGCASLAARLEREAGFLEQVYSIDPGGPGQDGSGTSFKSIDQLGAPGNYPRSLLLPNSPAVLSYTSGTMGNPKGVVTSLGNLISQVRGLQAIMHNGTETSCVSILPLNHLFELTATFLTVLYGGGRICYVNSLMPQDITRAMQQQKPTCMVVVPLFLKLIRKRIQAEVAKQVAWKRVLFSALLKVSLLMPKRLRRRLFQSIHTRFGGSLEYFACGGAPLDPATLQFFDRLGIPVYQGYGMAEASPVIASNAIGVNRPGSVGLALPGVEIRIAKTDGEILTRGPHVMRGYFDNPTQTAETIDADGWLHTGDIGYLDRDGYLYVNGRKKNIIVLGSGKNVHPEELEAVLFDHADIREGCIVGIQSARGISDGSEDICAVVVPHPDLIEACGIGDPNLQRRIERIIADQANRLAAWKRPARVVLLASELPKTATRKVKRREVARQLVIGG